MPGGRQLEGDIYTVVACIGLKAVFNPSPSSWYVVDHFLAHDNVLVET